VPIRSFHAGRVFDPDAITVMALAFDAVCDHLRLKSTSDDPVTRLIAEKVIEVAQRGVSEPDLLRAMALNELSRD